MITMNNAFINMHIAEQTAIQNELMLSQSPCSAWEPHGFNSFLGSQAWQSLTFYTCLVAELFGNEKSNGKQQKARESERRFENLDNSSLYLCFICCTSSGVFSCFLHRIAMHLFCRVRGISLVNAVISFSFFFPWPCRTGYFIIHDRYHASRLELQVLWWKGLPCPKQSAISVC